MPSEADKRHGDLRSLISLTGVREVQEGMQKGRGHRRNLMSSRYNVAGIGAIETTGAFCNTQNFGRVKQRYAGGVAYKDDNKNGRYVSL